MSFLIRHEGLQLSESPSETGSFCLPESCTRFLTMVKCRSCIATSIFDEMDAGQVNMCTRRLLALRAHRAARTPSKQPASSLTIIIINPGLDQPDHPPFPELWTTV